MQGKHRREQRSRVPGLRTGATTSRASRARTSTRADLRPGEFRGFRPGDALPRTRTAEAIRGPLRSARMTGPLGKLVREARWSTCRTACRRRSRSSRSTTRCAWSIASAGRATGSSSSVVVRRAPWDARRRPGALREAPPPSTRSRRRSCCWPPRWSTRERAADDHDAVVVPDDLLAWERRYGELPEHCAVLALTGWGSRADDPAAFWNADSGGPCTRPASAPRRRTSSGRSVPRRGRSGSTRRASTSAPPATSRHTRAGCRGGGFGIENLANLHLLPPAGATLIVGAPTFEGGSGGPARVLGLVS